MVIKRIRMPVDEALISIKAGKKTAEGFFNNIKNYSDEYIKCWIVICKENLIQEAKEIFEENVNYYKSIGYDEKEAIIQEYSMRIVGVIKNRELLKCCLQEIKRRKKM